MTSNSVVPLLLGIDLGTSSVKCLAIELDGKAISLASREYPISTPQPVWAEQDPQTWLDATVYSIQECMRRGDLDPERIVGIGLSGQMHGMVVLDRDDRPLRPAIIWADQRSQKQVNWVNDRLGRNKLANWTGNPLATGFMLASWLWLCENEPVTARRARRLLLPKDYLRMVLTGEFGSEPSDASSTSLFNPVTRSWSTSLLEALDIDPHLLPSIGESAQIAGVLRPRIARQLGLSTNIPVVYGGSDQAAQALGHGIIEPGVISCTIGTGGQLFAPVKHPQPDPELRLHLFCHAAPDLWHLEAAILSAGLALKWLRDNIFQNKDFASLAALAQQAPPGCEGLIFLPYLAGERTPWMDPQARGAFLGLSIRHNQTHIIRSVMEGVVFALRQGLELMQELDVPVEKIVASGGAIQHPLWIQLQADIFQQPIYCTETVEAAALGAALLAATGVGLYSDIQSAIRSTIHFLPEVIEPDPQNIGVYAHAFEQFILAYPTINFLH